MNVYNFHYHYHFPLHVSNLLLHSHHALDIVGSESPQQCPWPWQKEGPSKDHSLQYPPGHPKGWAAEKIWDRRSGLQWPCSQVSRSRRSIALQHKALRHKMQSSVFCQCAPLPSASQGISAFKYRWGGRGGGGGKAAAKPLHYHHHWGNPWPPSCGAEAVWWWKPIGTHIRCSSECIIEGSLGVSSCTTGKSV